MFNEVFRKDVTYINIRRLNPHLTLQNTAFENSQGWEGGGWGWGSN